MFGVTHCNSIMELVVVDALSVAPAKGAEASVRVGILLSYATLPAPLVTSTEYWYS